MSLLIEDEYPERAEPRRITAAQPAARGSWNRRGRRIRNSPDRLLTEPGDAESWPGYPDPREYAESGPGRAFMESIQREGLRADAGSPRAAGYPPEDGYPPDDGYLPDDGYRPDDRYLPDDGYRPDDGYLHDGYLPDAGDGGAGFSQDSGFTGYPQDRTGSGYPQNDTFTVDDSQEDFFAEEDVLDGADAVLDDDDPAEDDGAGEDGTVRGAVRQLARQFLRRPQRLAGLLVAAASILSAAVVLPSIFSTGSRSFAGVVSRSELTSLNFSVPGRVAAIRVRLGQVVRRGQVLATTAAALAEAAAVQADRVAVRSDRANIAALIAQSATQDSIATAAAQLAVDRAHRATDRRRLLSTEIVAPRRGTVVAIAGRPAASLGAAGRALPVIALRSAGGWQVSLAIPAASAAAVRVGQPVSVSVPALRLSGVRGRVIQLSQVPASSPGGAAGEEALVQVPGAAGSTPLSGMTADIQLGA
ncbi:MAG: biotin/lipoyl-binding protein [Streptosporangiales bacterium]